MSALESELWISPGDYLEGERDADPSAVFDVLPVNTAATDLREKRAAHLRIESLEYDVTLERNRTEATVDHREGTHWAIVRVTEGPGVTSLASIGCELDLGEICGRVVWDRVLAP